MKKLFVVLLLIILSLLLYFAEQVGTYTTGEVILDSKDYSAGLLKTEYKNLELHNKYDIEVNLDVDKKAINAKEKIVWYNKSDISTNEIQFHLYPNGYKSTHTEFAKGYDISAPDAKTEIKINNFSVNGNKKELIYFQPEIPNPYDSTVAKVILDSEIEPGDSVEIYFDYSMKIPRSVKRLGYATGRNFFFVSQWFPKVGVFENGKWICSQYHPYLNFYSDFGNYSVKITAPENYTIASTGVINSLIRKGNSVTYSVTQNGVHDFVWLASDEILYRTATYTRKDGSQIQINAYVQPEREKYFYRYFECVKNCLAFFEENIGAYPYQNISLVDVPRTSGAGGMEYPTLFTVSADLFSPQPTGWPEYLVAHEFTHQFFYGILANNEVYEAWLDEGFTSYIATKIMYKYYPDIFVYFTFAYYIPIYGLNFLSYNEIPLIYTLADIHLPEGVRSLSTYYRNLNVGTIADTSFKLPNRLSYVVNSYAKPELILHTLERYVGFNKMMGIIKHYYNEKKFKHPTADDFIEAVNKNTEGDMTWFFDDFYKSSKTFDYKVTSLTKTADDTYQVLVERLRDGVFKNDVVLYTDKETFKQKWDGTDRWKIFTFHTKHKVIAAEVDPKRKNLLDLNFANNSFTLETRTWASWSLAIRVFFWVQNALMILGSIG